MGTDCHSRKNEEDWDEEKWAEFHQEREGRVAKLDYLPEPFLWHIFGKSLVAIVP